MSWRRITIIACTAILTAAALLLGFIWWIILGGEQ